MYQVGDIALARPQGLFDSCLLVMYNAFDDTLARLDAQINLQWKKPLGHALRCLYIACAPTHLHISTRPPFSWALLPDIVFPELRELTLSMRGVAWQGPPIDLARVAPAPLRRTHVVGDFVYSHERSTPPQGHQPPAVPRPSSGARGYSSSVPALCGPEHIERIVIAPHAPHTARVAIIVQTRRPTLRYPHSRYACVVIGGCTHGQDIEPDER
jgi:hypothetical protein